jgi:hypothetical protein
MWQDYGSLGFQPICINMIDDWSVIKAFADTFSQLFLRDSTMAVWNMYNISGSIPLNYVLDTTGTVVYEAVGFDETSVRAEIEANLPPTGVSEGKVGKPLNAVSVAPNPTRNRALISFSLAKAGNASVRVYSSTGKLVRTVLSQTVSAGSSSATWDLRNDTGQRVTNGMYFYEVAAGSTVAHGKVSVLNQDPAFQNVTARALALAVFFAVRLVRLVRPV